MSILSSITAYGKRFSKSGGAKHLNPQRDWLLLLLVALVAILASVAWNVWFFFFALDAQTAVPNAPAAQTLDTSSINKARALFDTRAAEEARYRGEYRFNDPSK